jgi:hypothetical protein
MSTEREEKLEAVLAQFLKPIKGVPFEVVMKGLCGASVLKYEISEGNNEKTLELISNAMRSVCLAIQENPIKRPRPNEVGNDIEPFVINMLKKAGLNAIPPKTVTGKGKATGYPDVKIQIDGHPIYLEVKTYAIKSHNTTMRSFYLSPSDDPKVTEDAHHILVGFEVERTGNLYSPVAFELVDLYGLECDMKFEFNSDNKRLYQNSRILRRERV